MIGSEHPNTQIVKRAWRAVSEADVDSLREILAEDVIWHVTTRNPWYGDHVGHEAVIEYLASLGESGDAYDSTLEDVLASDYHALLVCGISAQRKGHSVESEYALLARFEGRAIAEVWTLPLEPEVLAKYWAS